LFVPEQPKGSSSLPGVLLATFAFGLAVLRASFCGVHSTASSPSFSGARTSTPMVQRRITFIRSSFMTGWPVFFTLPVPPLVAVSFSVFEGG
jgi:hypothetical protein